MINQTGIINSVSINLTINHTNDGDLFIMLKSPNGSTILSQYNGEGGQNYTNTTFVDTASTPITQGFPPYTGFYQPQGPLSLLNNQPLNGPWVLRIFASLTPDRS